MTQRDDGGPAFPFSPPCDQYGALPPGYPYPELGMTLRDWFAAHAPRYISYWAWERYGGPPEPERGAFRDSLEYEAAMQDYTHKRDAAWAFYWADLRIAARKGGEE